jgi:pimeloyl-ACP methyl ester carboxylesterase
MKYFSTQATRFFFIVLLVACGCGSDDTPGPAEEQFLVSSELIYSNTAEQLKFLIQLSGVDVDPNEFLYDIEIYRVVYYTTYDGSTITASGLIAIPKTTEQVGILSFHHGTITNRDDAPSNFSSNDFNSISYAAMASVGFIGVIPDYLGFGSSSSILHPYYVEDLTASSIVDMLKAAAEFAQQNNLQFNGKLFLAGYSEGGYSTMAAHKAIESDGLDGFNLIASFPGAGAYDLSGMQAHIFSLQDYNDPHYLAYMARAYQIEYDEDNLLTDFFKEPYASRIPGLFDGQKGADEINAQLTSKVADLIQEDMLANIHTNPEYDYLENAFEENSLTDWSPKVQMFMYHGLSDTTVPYQNSVDTYNRLLANGTSTSILTLTPLDGTHSSAIDPYIAAIIEKLLSLK